MAQPNDPDSPPFCLMMYGTIGKMTYEDVQKRLIFISNKLEWAGIKVLGYSADGDSRELKAMRLISELGIKKCKR